MFHQTQLTFIYSTNKILILQLSYSHYLNPVGIYASFLELRMESTLTFNSLNFLRYLFGQKHIGRE